MTRLYDRWLGIRFQASVFPILLTLALVSLGASTGCKKAPKKGEAAKTKTSADSKDTSMAGTGGLKAKDPKRKKVAGKSKIDTSGNRVGLTKPIPPGMNPASPVPVPTQPRPAAGPIKTQLVLGLNAAKLRKTFLWKKIMGIKAIQGVLTAKIYLDVKKGLGTDPLKVVDSARVVIGGTSMGALKNPKDLALIISGRFDAGATLKKLMKMPLKPGDPKPVLTKIGGKDAIQAKDKKDASFALVAMNKNTLALCASSMLEVVTKGDLSGGDAGMAAQLKTVSSKSLVWAVFGAVKMPAGATTGALAALSKIRGGSVLIDSDKTKWTLVNRLDVGTPQAAKSLLQLVTMAKLALGRAKGKQAKLAAFLKKMTLATKAQHVIATIELKEAEVKGLVDALIKKL